MNEPLNEPITTNNCNVNPLLIMRICERSYVLPSSPENNNLKVETHEYESDDEQLVHWTWDNDYNPEYDQVFNDCIPERERL